jgi:hypothetical protein
MPERRRHVATTDVANEAAGQDHGVAHEREYDPQRRDPEARQPERPGQVSRRTAVTLAAVMLKTGKGKNPLKPVLISAEGSTFYKSKLFRPKLERYTAELMNDQFGIYCDYVKAENATLVGTALAAITD